MRVSALNEAHLKKALRAEDKDAEIKSLTVRIEELENNMNEDFSAGYLDVINKCAILEQLQEDLHGMRTSSAELVGEAQDAQLRQTTLLEEHDEIQRSIERLKEIQHGFVHVHEFLEEAAAFGKSEDVYGLTRCLRRMEATKAFLKRYSFYKSLNICYKGLFDDFMKLLKNKARQWVRDIDFVGIGKRIDLKPRAEVFDRALLFRRQLLSGYFLEVAYASRRLGLENTVMEVIDAERELLLGGAREAIAKGKNTNVEDVIHFSVAFILLSSCLVEFFPNSRPFYDEAFDVIFDADLKVLSVLVPLKRMVTHLRMGSERLDAVVEKAVYRHLEEQIPRESFMKNLRVFVEDSIKFLNEIAEFSNELDELLAKKVDELLMTQLRETMEAARGEEDECAAFTEFQGAAGAVLELLVSRKPLLGGFEFTVVEQIDRQNRRYIERRYKEAAEKIKRAKKMADAVHELLSLKNFMNEACRDSLVKMIAQNYKDLLAGRNKDDINLFSDALERNFN